MIEGDRTPHEFVYKDERFASNTPDPEWISALAAEKDWIIIASIQTFSESQSNVRRGARRS